MRLKAKDTPVIEVDMVPLIDIVTLLLMFLVIVGSVEKVSHGVKINLPRADQAKSEKDLPITREGRIVLSLKSVDGVYYAYTGSATRYEITARNSSAVSGLTTHLLNSAAFMHREKMCKLLDDGTYNIPIKLRIGEDVPMRAVEDALDAVVRAKLRDVHYAAQPQEVVH